MPTRSLASFEQCSRCVCSTSSNPQQATKPYELILNWIKTPVPQTVILAVQLPTNEPSVWFLMTWLPARLLDPHLDLASKAYPTTTGRKDSRDAGRRKYQQ